MNRTSPMMKQYKTIKEQHPDKLLMFQVGDFYELFFEDARLAAREMEIALTSRDAGSEEPIPLAGIPMHSAETYINKLLNKGYKVVLCEQAEDAAQAKGLVKREITGVLTPGTITDPEMLEESRNNYLAALIKDNSNYYGLAAVDISTGDFQITEQKGEGAWETIADELHRLQPSELLCHPEDVEEHSKRQLEMKNSGLIETLPYLPAADETKQLITGQWSEETWEELDLDNYPQAAAAGGAVLAYLQLLQQLPEGEKQFHRLELYFTNRNLVIDNITSRNLELTQSLREGTREGSLLGLLDRCMTAMGRRLLRRWLEMPLVSREQIEQRLEAVTEYLEKPLPRRELRKLLQEIFDLERFCSRLSYQRINARDLVSLKNTLYKIETLKTKLADCQVPYLREIYRKLPDFNALIVLVETALVDDPPLTLKEGGLFKAGYHEEIDYLKKISSEGNTYLLDFEQKERERTGIKSLRVGYNRNFGYYIEVTKTNLHLVPPEYHRKQTLVNAERFTTEELQQMEAQITGAREKLAELEYSLFEQLRSEVSTYTETLLSASNELARLDCIQGLAEVAERNSYCRPSFSGNKEMSIKQSRHPVVEQLASEPFVPNDIHLDNNHYLLVITGPNMAGKSTYIRSAALLTIMAQMGSYVPADMAELPVLDRIFARVGATDDLSRGHSTFMVEMQETAAILQEATADSLIILDEIGRGTSTYDGMSIARSVLEFISRKIKAKTLFSTHYHELTNLEGELPGIKNYTIAVREKGKEVIFLRQLIPGKADKSYGINVARLAGVPAEVLIRAEKILHELELAASSAEDRQLSLLPMVSEPSADHTRELEIVDQLKEIDINRTTPLEALQKLYNLQKQLDQEESEEE
ncbi:MAG: DNA mismatch repair protein MutS [Bacillota bacterium]